MKKAEGDPLALTRAIIRQHGLRNWLDEYPWLTGFIGEPKAPVWFVAENPSLRGIQEVGARADALSPNLQWTCRPGTSSGWLRDAITAAGLKVGDPCVDGSWRCYLTNADKEPQEVRARNKGKKGEFMAQQAGRWLPVLQAEIDRGAPQVLVALGRQAQTLLSHMRSAGLHAPKMVRIDHHSYVWLRPESGTRRGPRHPERIREFMESIKQIAETYGESNP